MAKGGFKGGYGGYGGGASQANMIKQAQKMQQEMLKMQEELDSKTYTSTVGGGAVTAVVSGKRQVVSLTISPDAVDPEDVEMLQDMVIAAINSALITAENASNEGMAKITGGMNFGF